MMWWEAKSRSGSTIDPFEEETDHLKTPQVLLGNLDQLKINFENNIPGAPRRMEKWLQLTTSIEKVRNFCLL